MLAIKILFVCILTGFSLNAVGSGVYLSISDRMLTGSMVYLDGQFVSHTGEFFFVSNGKHRLKVDIDNDQFNRSHPNTNRNTSGKPLQRLHIDIQVSNNEVFVESSTGSADECHDFGPHGFFGYKWKFVNLNFSLVNNFFSPSFFLIEIDDYKFKTDGERLEWCGPPAGLFCDQSPIILSVASKPTGAEIWIDGNRTNFKTNNELSYPVCFDKYRYRDITLDLTLKREGYVNCNKQVISRPNENHAIECEMKKIRFKR